MEKNSIKPELTKKSLKKLYQTALKWEVLFLKQLEDAHKMGMFNKEYFTSKKNRFIKSIKFYKNKLKLLNKKG